MTAKTKAKVAPSDGKTPKPQPKPKPQRRTQSERTAATRKILLDATVKCLFEHGYGATTTILVAEEAGVSRGAMLHQFPSKADLMTFVVEASFEEEIHLYNDLLSGIDSPRERMIAYPMAVWNVLSRPAGVAVLEILQGSRSDLVLAEKLKPVQARIEESARAGLAKEFPRGLLTPLLELIVGSARGLTISQIISPNENSAPEAIALLQKLLRIAVESGELRTSSKS